MRARVRETLQSRLAGARRAVVVLVVIGLAALAYGPVRYLISPDHDLSPSAISLSGDPYASPSLARWPVGVVDTAVGGVLSGTGGRSAPVGRFITPEQARTQVPGTAYVSVTGPVSGHSLPGVGTVVTHQDAESLMSLPEPARTETIGYLTGTTGAALGLVSMDRMPTRGAKLVNSRSTEQRQRLLADGDPDVKELIDVWAQRRPDISVLVSPDARGAGDESIGAVGMATSTSTRGRETAVTTATVARSIMRGLAQRDAVVAPELFSAGSRPGLFDRDKDGVDVTTTGQAYVVAALAVPPGSKLAPTTSTGGLTALAFERPRGGASVLVWNPGATQRVTIDLPYGDTVHRVRLMMAGGAMTGVLLHR